MAANNHPMHWDAVDGTAWERSYARVTKTPTGARRGAPGTQVTDNWQKSPRKEPKKVTAVSQDFDIQVELSPPASNIGTAWTTLAEGLVSKKATRHEQTHHAPPYTQQLSTRTAGTTTAIDKSIKPRPLVSTRSQRTGLSGGPEAQQPANRDTQDRNSGDQLGIGNQVATHRRTAQADKKTILHGETAANNEQAQTKEQTKDHGTDQRQSVVPFTEHVSFDYAAVAEAWNDIPPYTKPRHTFSGAENTLVGPTMSVESVSTSFTLGNTRLQVKVVDGSRDAHQDDVHVEQAGNASSGQPVQQVGSASSGRSKTVISREKIQSFIPDWVEQIEGGIHVDLSDREVHQHSDINPDTGGILDPVTQPDSIPDFLNTDSELQHRQQNWSSNLIAAREMARRRGGGDIIAPFSTRGDQDPPKYQDGILSPEPITGPTEVTTAAMSRVNPHAAKVICHIRPAKITDMPSCAAMYNLEVTSGEGTLDIQEVVPAQFEMVLERCRKLQLPFITVVKGAWPDALGYHGKVVGFGFMDTYRTGMSPGIHSITSALAYVFVHPEYRRKKIGTGLLDKLMSVTSAAYTRKDGIVDLCLEYDPVYASAHQAPFNAHRIYAEVLVHPQDSEAQKKFEGFLKGVFKFEQVAVLDSFHQEHKNGNTEWMNMHVYEFRGDDEY